MLDLPGFARRVIDAAETDGIQVRLPVADLEPLVGRAERIGNRLVAGMIGAALISGIGGMVSGERRWRSWEGSMVGAGLAALGAAIGVGLIRSGASAAVGLNPGAATKIMVQAILSIAFAEAIVFYALFLVR